MKQQVDVLVYSSDSCGFCFRVKKLLQQKQVKFIEVNVDGKPEQRQVMTQKSGQRTVPQIWLGEKHIGGCDDLFLLERQNRLDELLFY